MKHQEEGFALQFAGLLVTLGRDTLSTPLPLSIIVSRWLGAGKTPQALERMQPSGGNLNIMAAGFEFTENFL